MRSSDSRNLRLQDGNRVAIVGGGPAGSFFANLLIQDASDRGLHLDVTIFDAKRFDEKGPKGCNMCAGVISQRLLDRLATLGFEIPESRIQSRVKEYRCITQDAEYSLYPPEDGHKILTVYRGNGPLLSDETANVSFDEFLLQRAVSGGARVETEPVRALHVDDDKATVTFGPSGKVSSVEVDLVVVATGLNTRFLEVLQKMGFGYRPPRTTRTCQAEIPFSDEQMRERFKDVITVFTLGLESVRFGAFTPKRDYLTLSLIGRKDLSKPDLMEFLQHPKVRALMPAGWEVPERLCVCFPNVATKAARRPFSDRLVVIGDAAANRFYKNGIESAFLSARRAVRTILRSGYSREAFRKEYLPHIKKMDSDNRAGRLVYWLNDRVSRNKIMRETQMRVALDNRNPRARRLLSGMLWSTFTGNEPYWKILRKVLSPVLQWRIFSTGLAVTFGRILHLNRALIGAKKRRLISGAYGPLRDRQRVVIIGGGPAGASCAIALKNISTQLRREIDVVIYEPKDFSSDQGYNQCAGVLSPPLCTLLERDLNVPFPTHLVQRTITGYVLHSDHQSLALGDEGDETHALRRISFDDYLFNEATKRGVQVVNSRVTGLEFYPERALVYSESDSREADVVVGAFGMDPGTCLIFERATAYKQPRAIETIVTKLHPGDAFMEQFGTEIHAFLPSIRSVEFGAVTPKGNHLTINVAGETIVADDMTAFLGLPQVKALLPEDVRPEDLPYFKGQFPNGPGKNVYGDRYLIIGDAAGLLRPFKGKGVTAACRTGILAAQTIINRGISEGALSDFYRRMDDVTRDRFYGKVLRQVAIKSANWHVLDGLLERAKEDDELKRALFHAVSGQKSFRRIVRDHLGLAMGFRAAAAMARWRLKGPR